MFLYLAIGDDKYNPTYKFSEIPMVYIGDSYCTIICNGETINEGNVDNVN